MRPRSDHRRGSPLDQVHRINRGISNFGILGRSVVPPSYDGETMRVFARGSLAKGQNLAGAGQRFSAGWGGKPVTSEILSRATVFDAASEVAGCQTQ